MNSWRTSLVLLRLLQTAWTLRLKVLLLSQAFTDDGVDVRELKINLLQFRNPVICHIPMMLA